MDKPKPQRRRGAAAVGHAPHHPGHVAAPARGGILLDHLPEDQGRLHRPGGAGPGPYLPSERRQEDTHIA